MSRRVVVIGAGVAGLAAAFAARKRGLDVTLVAAGAGATALGGGAVDDLPWEAWFSAALTVGSLFKTSLLSNEVEGFSEALGLWDLPPADAPAPLVATASGRLRPARGRDKGLLDLGSLCKTTVLVPRAPRAGWDADALAATLESEPLARRAELRFLPVDAPILRFANEARFVDADLALRHDDLARVSWLADRLRELRARHPHASAILLGSWLGTVTERATELSERVGIPVGEVLVGVGSSAGLRFEAAQQELLTRLGVKVVTGSVVKLRHEGNRIELLLADGSTRIAADAAVLAVGGVASGGIVYDPPEHHAGDDSPPRVAPPFVLSIDIDVPVTLAFGTRRLDAGGSLHGLVLDTAAWPSDAHASLLESVGVLASDGKVCPGIIAAGDVVAGQRRTLLDAVASGIRAGQTI